MQLSNRTTFISSEDCFLYFPMSKLNFIPIQNILSTALVYDLVNYQRFRWIKSLIIFVFDEVLIFPKRDLLALEVFLEEPGGVRGMSVL
jgi:hypothetical protein